MFRDEHYIHYHFLDHSALQNESVAVFVSVRYGKLSIALKYGKHKRHQYS